MSPALAIGIEGVGVWSSEFADWPSARAALGQGAKIAAVPAARPPATILPAGERRRAPESVLIALEVAQQACAMATRDPRDLAHVFACAYGDTTINDYLCATLARAPNEVSPTKFHNSVHNAPAGYWAIASGCMRASTAISAGAASFGAGLFEAALLATCADAPVLLVVSDVAACGPLREVIPSRRAMAVALVLAPDSPRASARLRVQTGEVASAPPLLHASTDGNCATACLPLLTALARRAAGRLQVAAGPRFLLDMEISF